MTAPNGSATMAPLPKQRLHQLIDELPDDEIQAAQRYLEFLAACQDPLLEALNSAPDDDEPITSEEHRAVQEAERAAAAGDVVPDSHVRAKLGL
ncbi:MAG: hypothetical protein OXI64_05990 [Defluviicoccus sp.]|nr:hypothetical protein [Defluviicoccus sp.]